MGASSSSRARKRPRLSATRGILGYAASRLAQPCAPPMVTPRKRKPEQDDDLAMSYYSEPPEIDGSFAEDSVYECHCCYRTSKDSSYTVIGGEVEFQYVSKQVSACKDCHTVWRLLYKAKLTLILFARFLDSCWDNRVQFFRQLIALLTLRQENCSRATAHLITARVDVLKFAFELVGVPFPFFQAIPLAKIADGKPHPSAASLGFVEVLDEGADGQEIRKMMCLTALGPDGLRPPPSSWPLAAPSSQQQRIRRNFYTHSEEEARLWSSSMLVVSGDETEQLAVAQELTPVKAGSNQDAQNPPDSVTAQKYRDARNIASAALAEFASEKVFSDLKERPLGKHLGKLLKMQHEVTNGPEARLFVQPMALLVDGLSSAKKTLAPLLAYQKTFAPVKLNEIYENSKELRILFKELKLSFSPKLRCIFWRSDFAQAART